MGKRKNRNYKRGFSMRDARLYVIACEGEKTEKKYFQDFCKDFKRVKIEVLATGTDHKSAPSYVLKRAENFVNEYGMLGIDDRVWIVIDMDNWKEKELSEVAQRCQQKKDFQLILSHPCFELWLYLHLENPTLELNDSAYCKDFKQVIRSTLGSYNPANLNINDFIERTTVAIQKAKDLDINPEHRFPNNKATRVYLLVEKLLELKT